MAKYLEFKPRQLRSDRSDFGQYGLAYFGDNLYAPFLNAKRADELVNPGEILQDFSHGRGLQSADLGWSSNSFSNVLAQGASVFDILKHENETYGTSYSGDLNKAAQFLGIDPSQYKDKYVPQVTADQFDEWGNLIQKGGEPLYPTDEYGNRVSNEPLMKLVSAQDQLYDAINEKGADYFRWTGDSLIKGAASEGGPQSFQTVLYKREGDVLKPISAPVSHGGYQNLDVYTGGSGFNFGRDMLPGLTLVAGGALGMYGLDQLLTAGAASALGGGSTFGGLNPALPAAGTSWGGLSSAVPAAGKVFGGLSYALPAASTAGSGLSLASVLRTAKQAKDVFDQFDSTYKAATGGGGGGGGSASKTISAGSNVGINPNALAALNSLNASNSMLPQGGIYKTASQPFAPQPIFTDVITEEKAKDEEDKPNFGLADILRNFQNYG